MTDQYDKTRCPMLLDEAGGYYYRHVDAMTREDLYSKSEIAAELGHRDMVVDQLTARVEELEEWIESNCYDIPGEASRRAKEVLLSRQPAASLLIHDAEVLDSAVDEFGFDMNMDSNNVHMVVDCDGLLTKAASLRKQAEEVGDEYG